MAETLEVPVDADAARAPRFAGTLAAVFGPRPLESALWGAALGLIAGAPLILSNFMLHGIVVTLMTVVVDGAPLDLELYGTIAPLATVVGGVALVGLIGLCVLVARLRRASLATMLLVAYFASVVPYWLFYAFAISR